MAITPPSLFLVRVDVKSSYFHGMPERRVRKGPSTIASDTFFPDQHPANLRCGEAGEERPVFLPLFRISGDYCEHVGAWVESRSPWF